MIQYATLEDTVYLWFGSNDTSGSGDDGASALFDVREGGAAADAVPVLSGSATLLTDSAYPAGCYEVAVAATTANGFSADKTYGVFCTLAVDGQNPTGLIGSFRLAPVPAALPDSEVTALIEALLEYDVDNVEATAAIHSLASVILKLVSRFVASTGTTYRTDGTTPHMVQAVTQGTLTPITELGVGT